MIAALRGRGEGVSQPCFEPPERSVHSSIARCLPASSSPPPPRRPEVSFPSMTTQTSLPLGLCRLRRSAPRRNRGHVLWPACREILSATNGRNQFLPVVSLMMPWVFDAVPSNLVFRPGTSTSMEHRSRAGLEDVANLRGWWTGSSTLRLYPCMRFSPLPVSVSGLSGSLKNSLLAEVSACLWSLREGPQVSMWLPPCSGCS